VAAPFVVTVEVLALRVICHACGASARIVNDDYGRHSLAGGAFFTSHYAPELIAADVTINGQTRTFPVRHAA
jgi:hypothetical protein